MGVSIGTIVGVSDPFECLSHCKDTPDCEWYTSNPGTASCTLYSTCAINVDDCPDCVCGEKDRRESLICVSEALSLHHMYYR